MPRARIYERISSDREGEEIGVGRQDETCRELAARLGAELVEPPYMDNDAGASTLSRAPRPDYERLLADAEADSGSLILAYSNSRLTRRPAEWEDLIKLYERSKVTVHTWASGTVDLSKADGRAVARTIAAWDAAEAERTGERVKEDVKRRAKKGLFHGGGRSFGWTTGHELHPAESEILIDWVDRLIKGEALSLLAREARQKNIPTARGGQWKANIIRQMMLNPRIAGLRKYDEDKYAKAVWPAIVSEEKWRQVEAVLTDKSRHSGGSTARVHLLTGLALCHTDDRPVGSKLTISRKTGRRVSYICKTCGMSRRTDAIDLYVVETIVDLLERYEDEPAGVDAEQLAVVKRITDHIEKVRQDFANADTDDDPADLRATLRLLRGRLRTEEAKLQPRRQVQVVKGVTGPVARRAWGGLSLSRKRAIIDSLVEVRLLRSPAGRRPFDPETVQILPK